MRSMVTYSDVCIQACDALKRTCAANEGNKTLAMQSGVSEAITALMIRHMQTAEAAVVIKQSSMTLSALLSRSSDMRIISGPPMITVLCLALRTHLQDTQVVQRLSSVQAAAPPVCHAGGAMVSN